MTSARSRSMPGRVQLSREPEATDRWRIDPVGAMSVPGIVFASKELLSRVEDQALQQVVNVATLPGIVEASYAMPDIHWGYGFPIGGVAATDVERGGVISPGGVGFDISCGVRLLVSPISVDELAPRFEVLMDALDVCIPRGLGGGGVWQCDEHDLEAVLREGARAAVRAGLGTDADLARCEDGGSLAGADPTEVSERAMARGLRQVGSLGSGNHFLEVQVVDEVYDSETAEAFGLAPSQVCVMIHCGSRGLGHQICSDHVRTMLGAMPRYGISVPDRQLACAPVHSAEGQAYLGAMAAAANYGRANRQALSVAARQAFEAVVGTGELALVYDVSHNLAKLEHHEVAGASAAALRASQGCHPCAPARAPRSARRSAHRGPAGARPGLDGHGIVRAGGGGPRRSVLLGLPWGGANDEPPCRGPPGTSQRAAAPARVDGHRSAGQIGSRPGRGGAGGLQGRGRGRGHV